MTLLSVVMAFLCPSCNPGDEPEIPNNPPDPQNIFYLWDVFPVKASLPFTNSPGASNSSGDFFLTGLPFNSKYCYLSPQSQQIACQNHGVFIYKFDKNGTLLWRQSWLNETARVVAATSDGGCYVGSNDSDIIIRCIGANGTEKWKKKPGGPNDDYLYDIAVSSNDEVRFTGITDSFNILTAALSPDGNVLWSKIYYDPGQEIPHSILSTRDNGVLITGENGIPSVLILIKYNKYGEFQWVKEYALNDWTIGTSAIETESGNFIITGSVYQSYTYANLLLMETDSSGNILWNKAIDHFAGSEQGIKVIKGKNNDITVTGFKDDNLFVSNFDAFGNLLQSKEIVKPYVQVKAAMLSIDSRIILFFDSVLETPDTLFGLVTYTELSF